MRLQKKISYRILTLQEDKPLLILISLSSSQIQILIQHLGWGEILTVSQVLTLLTVIKSTVKGWLREQTEVSEWEWGKKEPGYHVLNGFKCGDVQAWNQLGLPERIVSLEVWYMIISPAINLHLSTQSYCSTIFLTLSLRLYSPL